ncbi:DUF2334 domain-containing protein [Paenibacillus sp. GD4]|uniref:DUF2334 domain-containing protein n=1 Tax=Paenibacillus sp. GD4 TaxID=3068890 RepID=UPI00279661B8|nr:DUF2334 domain-containing protein [Paenibacillus sp. GD4]MDQ1910128.1 DUF2334 domain-containing protein [Paenibacillus sp. GD4]
MAFFRKYKLARYVVSVLLVSVIVTAYHMISVEGEARLPKFVMMRLEDIGPGGQYETPEGLGKLRAILEYLRDEKVSYHLAVIPRWINISPDGSRYDVSLDQTDNPLAAAFVQILKDAVRGGATLGMHGYTHQVGSVRRDDGHHESGIGNEFNNPGSAETMPASYGEQRMKEGLAVLEHVGLKPQFWEAPHYRSTPEQDQVFRSYFGLHYQAEVQEHRNAQTVHYENKRNKASGASSLGAAYIPTPYDYIPYNKDEKVIVDRVGTTGHVASFFFHPFLDFKQLIPVINEDGEPVMRDGIPEYRLPDTNRSLLQKLIAGLRAKGYTFYSIQDYVPFTPAHSIGLSGGSKSMVGDVNGDGQADLVTWDTKTGNLHVVECNFRGQRNEAQPAPALWGQAAYVQGATAALSGADGSRSAVLWTLSPKGQLESYRVTGRQFRREGSWRTEQAGWSTMIVIPQANGASLLAGLSKDRRQLNGLLVTSGGDVKPLKPFSFRSEQKAELQLHKGQEGITSLLSVKSGASSGFELIPDIGSLTWRLQRTAVSVPNESGVLKLGDFNGDGREDVLRWDPDSMSGSVYLKQENDEYKLLSFYGPWGRGGSGLQPLIADLDGNGTSDLAVMNREEGYLDTALSFIHQ